MKLQEADSRDNHLLTTDSEEVLFRTWLFRSEGHTEGVIDLQRKVGDIYFDVAEAAIAEDCNGLLRLIPRGRGKDIPEKWHSIIEINLLAPVSTKAIKPHRRHVFGEGKLSKVVDFRFKFSEFDLREVKIISPEEYKRRGGGLIGDDWPDNYGAPPPTVFLCHSSKDKPFVRRLARELRDNRIDVWFDEENILIGQSFIDQIQDGIRKADYVAVVLTPNFLTGPWANRELQMAISREVQAGRVKVLPVLRKDCDIPEILRIKSYADLRGKNFAKGLRVLVTSIFSLSEENIT